MLKKVALRAACLMVAAATVFSCKYDKTETGLKYKILKDSSGENFPEEGGFIDFKFQMWNEEGDSLLDDQFKDMYPVRIGVPPVTYDASIEEGLRLLTAGDSAVFLLNADSLFLKTFGQPTLPPYVKPGTNIRMVVKMMNVYSKHYVDSIMTEQNKMMEEQLKIEKGMYVKDSIAIQDYMKKHHMKGASTIGGAYVVKTKQNNKTDLYLLPGDTVKAYYTGKLLENGKEFDKSTPGDPFMFILGSGQVIKGWDEGFQKFKKGEKGYILIPSRLGYGSHGARDIPAHAPLIFEVEVLE